jgi:hypothetical protein
MRDKSLTGREVLARMRRGDLPTLKGGYTEKSVFDDGRWVSHQVMRRLRQREVIDYPVGTSIRCTWTMRKPD